MRFLRTNEPREEELAALADGSLPDERLASVQAMVDESPEVAAHLAEQRRAVALVRGAAVSVEAPPALRARIATTGASARTPSRRRLVWAGGIAAAAGIAAAVLVLALPSNVPGGPSLAQAAVLGGRPASAPAPGAAGPTLLNAAVDGVPFPSWAKKFGWKATGTRTDTVGGRRATTVFYEKNGREIAYTIVSGDALAVPVDASRLERDGTELHLIELGGRTVVTWERLGRTCILSGIDVDAPTLAKLAAWNGKGSVPF